LLLEHSEVSASDVVQVIPQEIPPVGRSLFLNLRHLLSWKKLYLDEIKLKIGHTEFEEMLNSSLHLKCLLIYLSQYI